MAGKRILELAWKSMATKLSLLLRDKDWTPLAMDKEYTWAEHEG